MQIYSAKTGSYGVSEAIQKQAVQLHQEISGLENSPFAKCVHRTEQP